MTPCDACSTAFDNPLTGRINAGCTACEDRALSNAPRHTREAFLDGIADDAERARRRASIVAEWRRRKAFEVSA